MIQDQTMRPALPAGFRYSRRTVFQVLREERASGPVCHVGSLLHGKDQGACDRWRQGFANLGLSPFVGIDLAPGLNVDILADLCDPDLFDKHPDLAGRFGVVVCSALLEHVRDPFACARNIRKLMANGGHLYFSGPWAAGYHGYPDDFWRISFSGLKVLFPDLSWPLKWYSGTNPEFTVDFDDPPREERDMFAFDSDGAAVGLSSRSISYLMIGALGKAA